MISVSIVTFWHSIKYLGHIKFGSYAIGQIGKTSFATEFLQEANTLPSIVERSIRLYFIGTQIMFNLNSVLGLFACLVKLVDKASKAIRKEKYLIIKKTWLAIF